MVMAKRLRSVLISSEVFDGSFGIFTTEYLSLVSVSRYLEGGLSQAGKVEIMSMITKLMVGFLIAKLVILCMSGSILQIKA